MIVSTRALSKSEYDLGNAIISIHVSMIGDVFELKYENTLV